MKVALLGVLVAITIGFFPREGGTRMLIASASGPVPARTGGFGEMTCYQCHWDNPLNDTAGRISLSGVPETFTPGERYLITVAIAHPELVKGGFQMSARFEDGKNAGTFRSPDELTTPVPDDDGRVTYIQHTGLGSKTATEGQSRWNVEWTAPPAGARSSFTWPERGNGDASRSATSSTRRRRRPSRD